MRLISTFDHFCLSRLLARLLPFDIHKCSYATESCGEFKHLSTALMEHHRLFENVQFIYQMWSMERKKAKVTRMSWKK